MLSASEETFALHVRAMELPQPEREYRFHPHRRWKIDFAWPGLKIAVEIEGGTRPWKTKSGKITRGRHTTELGFEQDAEKYNAMAERGWRLFRFTSKMVRNGTAIDQMKRILA